MDPEKTPTFNADFNHDRPQEEENWNQSGDDFWLEDDHGCSLQDTAEATTDHNLQQLNMAAAEEDSNHHQTTESNDDEPQSTESMDETNHYEWDPDEEDNWDYTEEDLARGKAFQQHYLCSSLGPETQGTRILMPASALEQLMTSSATIQFPMVFEITNPSSEKVSHCGVLEFSSDEGFVMLPPGMMENLKLEEGQLVSLKSTSLAPGTFMKIQPHSTDFIELSDPRAVLERGLRDFSCVTTGDTILVNHDNKKYYINILETKPTNAISLVDTDCSVDFAPPLDYKEPEKKKAVPVKTVVQEEGSKEEESKFRAFSGASRRLDGRQSTASAIEVVDTVVASASSKVDKKENGLQPALRWTSKENPASTISKVDKKDTSTKHDQPKFQPFTGKKYTLG